MSVFPIAKLKLTAIEKDYVTFEVETIFGNQPPTNLRVNENIEIRMENVRIEKGGRITVGKLGLHK